MLISCCSRAPAPSSNAEGREREAAASLGSEARAKAIPLRYVQLDVEGWDDHLLARLPFGRSSGGNPVFLPDVVVFEWNVIGFERFTRAIGGEEQGEWHAWTSESVAGKGRVVAGYATTYKDFQFITVKGAGHEVPRYRPVAALTMLRKFLKNETF